MQPFEVEGGEVAVSSLTRMAVVEAKGGRRVGTARLLVLLTVSMFGIGYAWATQYARVPSVLEEMGVSDDGVSLAFLAGPIAGFIVQPIVGALSDRTRTRYGKRTPWIVGALGLMVLSFAVLGEAYSIGAAVGDGRQPKKPGAARTRAIVVAVAAFWLLDFAQNAVQLPTRTLVSDILRPQDLAAGNAAFAMFDGLGKMISYGLAATSFGTVALFKLKETEPNYVTDARVQFAIASAAAFVCVGITVCAVREPDQNYSSSPSSSSSSSSRQEASLGTATVGEAGLAAKEKSADDDDGGGCGAIRRATAVAWRVIVGDGAASSSGREHGEKKRSSTKKRRRRSGGLKYAPLDTSEFEDSSSSSSEDSSAVSSGGAGDGGGGGGGGGGGDGGARDDISTLRAMCFVEFGLWFGLSAWQVWGAVYAGKAVYGGAPSGTQGADAVAVAKFEGGVRLFSLGLAGANLISLLFAPAAPALQRRFGARRLLRAAAGVETAVLALLALLPRSRASYTAVVSALITRGPQRPHGGGGGVEKEEGWASTGLRAYHASLTASTRRYDAFFTATPEATLVAGDPEATAALTLLALLGVPWAIHMNVPYSTVGRTYQADPNVGLYMATMNTALCLAQLAMALSMPPLLYAAAGDITVCFAASALVAATAIFASRDVAVPYDESDADIDAGNFAAPH